MEVCLQVVGWEACWGQRVGGQKAVGVGVPSLFQKEAVVVAAEVADLAILVSERVQVQMLEQELPQAQAKGHGTAPPAAPF